MCRLGLSALVTGLQASKPEAGQCRLGWSVRLGKGGGCSVINRPCHRIEWRGGGKNSAKPRGPEARKSKRPRAGPTGRLAGRPPHPHPTLPLFSPRASRRACPTLSALSRPRPAVAAEAGPAEPHLEFAWIRGRRRLPVSPKPRVGMAGRGGTGGGLDRARKGRDRRQVGLCIIRVHPRSERAGWVAGSGQRGRLDRRGPSDDELPCHGNCPQTRGLHKMTLAVQG